MLLLMQVPPSRILGDVEKKELSQRRHSFRHIYFLDSGPFTPDSRLPQRHEHDHNYTALHCFPLFGITALLNIRQQLQVWWDKCTNCAIPTYQTPPLKLAPSGISRITSTVVLPWLPSWQCMLAAATPRARTYASHTFASLK